MKSRSFTYMFLALAASAALMCGCSSSAQAAGMKETETAAQEGGSRLEEIKERGYLEVAMEPYLAPFEFIDPGKTGDEMYVGADVELAKYIADKLGVECRIIPLEFAAVLSSVTEGKYDMAISGLAYTPARAEAMEMSKGYFYGTDEALYGILVSDELIEGIKTKEDLKDKTVVVQSGSIQEIFASELPEGCGELKFVSATTDGYLMVQEGKADCCITAIKPAELYLKANPDCGMSISPYIEFEVDKELQGTRICMQKGETRLLDEVNSILDEVIETGIFEEWYDEYSELAASLGV
ncbi:MAG TPA: amino acid ABC transporter substrate-binding protein [Candidatus Avilachnospira avicola]|nr:amino acid ABC transporter substrate-binding protein [Candidatus Avilachnospira avicola]